MITFERHPDSYRHWKLSIEGEIARLALDVEEDGGLKPGYKLKLNSYDLGVDIELADALNRLRFEHPNVRVVILASGKERMFCSGANIYMLGQSSHDWKVNFCKFTNETRNGMEDSSRHEGLKFLAAVNGPCAGGGYELALACDEIVMVDDRSSTVSLPEVPLLGVLPGTGGLTRVTDKRKVRRDLADVFCTNPDGVKAERAKAWGLVDSIAAPNAFEATVEERARALAAQSSRPREAEGVELPPLAPELQGDLWRYRHLEVRFERAGRRATLTIFGPKGEAAATTPEAARALGAAWWPLAMARELDDAISLLRVNEPTIGTLVLKTRGEIAPLIALDGALLEGQDDWFCREVLGYLRRTLARLDVTARSLLAVIDEGSCFAGTLFELALAADRSYMLDLSRAEAGKAPAIALSPINFGALPMVNGRSRLATRFNDEATVLKALEGRNRQELEAEEALALGLVTFAPDDIDWEDEVRLAVEERASLSPDALSGLEANLRFPGAETSFTKIFARLSAWQNWIFNRPNAVGEKGALKLYGTGSRAEFDWKRI